MAQDRQGFRGGFWFDVEVLWAGMRATQDFDARIDRHNGVFPPCLSFLTDQNDYFQLWQQSQQFQSGRDRFD